MKTAKDYMEAANEAVPTMDSADAIAIHAEGEGTFIDVRDSADIAESGTIKGANRVPRGMIEFNADPAMEDLFNPIFKDKSAPYYLVCGAGGQAALAGKTMTEMGFTNVTNIGGFPGWKDAGGPTES
ncbi:Rhodanese-related sulfurtransferase [Cognatiyoonia koreensis]|uniref:Rhodanese-related sulfurtransferase n=1 Tax=Cognatiyoonia koreensis TaxID=364200 RepID=A0A1I0RVP8_9RHOB|nr:rhodanese-like domain-containing protein [Cognatiyoonia koreensis]SEW45506.1 Rhodanese-related sulfurtransferase [Cognatiyoonia koreensis]